MEIVLHRKESVLGAWSYSPWPVTDGDGRAQYLLPLDAEKPPVSPKKPAQIHRTARKTLDLRALSTV
jgi:hypothetical protein